MALSLNNTTTEVDPQHEAKPPKRVKPPVSAQNDVLGPETNNNQVNGDDTIQQPKSTPRKVYGCSERLAGLRPQSPILLPPLQSCRKLTPEEEALHIKSVYTDAVARLRSRSPPKKDDSASMAKIIYKTKEEIQNTIDRLAFESVSNRTQYLGDLMNTYDDRYRQQNRTAFTQTYYPSGVLSPRQLKVSVARLYTASRTHERETMEKLAKMYCPPMTSPRRTTAELAASSLRLSSSKSKK